MYSSAAWWQEKLDAVTAERDRLRAECTSVADALRRISDERARLYAALDMLSQVRHVSGSEQDAFRSNLQFIDAVLEGADVRNIETVEAIAMGMWRKA